MLLDSISFEVTVAAGSHATKAIPDGVLRGMTIVAQEGGLIANNHAATIATTATLRDPKITVSREMPTVFCPPLAIVNQLCDVFNGDAAVEYTYSVTVYYERVVPKNGIRNR